MAFCTKCGATIPDGSAFCTSCGATVGATAPGTPAPGTPAPEQPVQQTAPAPAPQPQYQQQFQQQYQQPQYQQAAPDIYDHTSEFDPKDVSDNKVIAMLIYLSGVIGLFISFICGSTNSPYASFHARQFLKIYVIEILTVICTALLFWTFIVPIAAGIFTIVLEVIKIICFFQVCGGKAKEPAIVRGFKFLK